LAASVKPVPSATGFSPVTPSPAIRIPPPGMCHFHPSLPAVYVCGRCGKEICRDDAKSYENLVMCPQCYQSIVPIISARAYQPALQLAPLPPKPMGFVSPVPMGVPPHMGMFPPARSTWGFVVSVIAGVMIIINAAALLSNSFYAMWVGIFPWIASFGPFPSWILVAIGLILGIVVAIGSILMVLGYGTIGAVVVFPAAVISLILGGGFVVGFILGVIGGIVAMLGK